LVFTVMLASSALLGCGGAAPKQKAVAPRAQDETYGVAQAEAPPAAGAVKEANDRVAMKGAGGKAAGGAPADPAAANAVNAAPAPQMIIFNATLDVIVKDLDAATPDVEKLVAGHKGFVAKSEVRGDTGSRRTATYTLRVPVANFAALKEGIIALGTPERNVVDTQDVTEEFIDVEARIKNLKEQEDKLNELLKEKRKEEKLEDVIRVSDRIYVVRGEIERAQGRRNYLQNRVQLSTINVTLREIKDYKPTAPTFGARIGDTFGKSWEALVDCGQGLVLVMVALAPWAPLWLPLVVALAWSVRRLVRISRENAALARTERAGHPRRHRLPRGEEPGEATAVEPVRPPEDPRPPA
jgi:hypothetical protein